MGKLNIVPVTLPNRVLRVSIIGAWVGKINTWWRKPMPTPMAATTAVHGILGAYSRSIGENDPKVALTNTQRSEGGLIGPIGQR